MIDKLVWRIAETHRVAKQALRRRLHCPESHHEVASIRPKLDLKHDHLRGLLKVDAPLRGVEMYYSYGANA
jgi:hypothetical protein